VSIYVEILIRAPLDDLWSRTQTPDIHERWDLRFSRIDYLPKRSEAEPQRFRYATRIGFGLEVAGEGQSVGERDGHDGSRTSSLKFSSADPRSIIREGAGYWKYIPTADGVTFLTWYDYRTRFGAAGAAFDRAIFRPLLGWATAWSFDRLRLWLERGIDPALSLRNAAVHAVARVALAFVFLYHGLVPKLLLRHFDEIAMLLDAGVPPPRAAAALTALGLAEVLIAFGLVIFWRSRWPLAFCIVLMLLATAGVALNSPRFLGAAFNPVSLNAAVVAIAVIDLLLLDHVPSSTRCSRQPQRDGR
jgi:hypothetical protein